MTRIVKMVPERLGPAVATVLQSLQPPLCLTLDELRLVLLHAVAASLDGLDPPHVTSYLLEITKLLDKADKSPGIPRHITPDARCVCCGDASADYVTRLVSKKDGTADADALLFGAATCWPCAEKLGRMLDSQSRNGGA